MDIKKFFSKNKDVIKKYLLIFGALLLLSILIGSCMLVLTPIPSDPRLIFALFKNINVLIFNILPIFFVLGIIFCITNRMWISFLSTSVLSFIIVEVNRFKIFYRDDPFLFEDIFLASEAALMTEEYSLFLDKVSICAIIFIIVGTLLCFFFIKLKSNNKYFRIVTPIVFLAVLILSCNTYYFSSGAKSNEIYVSMWNSVFGNQWKESNQYISRGVVYSFIRSIPEAFLTKPNGYVEDKAAEVIDDFESVQMDDDKKVHIISIMLEAYNDFSEFEGVEFDVDPYENFHKLQEDSYSGKLYTNIFAADTIQTERAFLTGFNDIDFYEKETESYVSYFKNQGYYTEAMHPCYGWFYNRRNINEYLGFDNFFYQENKFGALVANDQYYGMMGDSDFFGYIIEGYEDALDDGSMYFNFSVTYQNHGPYSSTSTGEVEYAIKKNEYSEAEYNIFNNYLRGIKGTDNAIGELREYIDNREEPIVLILFGDHNPWLGDNNSVYEMLGIDLDLDTPIGAANYYQTPYLFYANEEAENTLDKEFEGEGSTISPMFLMSEYFEYIEMEGPSYLNYLNSLMEKYEVLNTIYVGKDEEYVLRSEVNDDVILEQKWVEYYIKSK